MKWSTGWRKLLILWAPVLGPSVLVIASLVANKDDPSPWAVWTLIVLGVLVVGAGFWGDHRKRREERSERQWLTEKLANVMDEISNVPSQTPKNREATAAPVRDHISRDLMTYLEQRRHGGKLRVVVYELDQQHNEAKPVARNGRRKNPEPFIVGTTRGDSAIEFMRSGNATAWPDVTKHPPEGWDGSAKDYKSFMSSPVTSGFEAYGMISVDSPHAGYFRDHDVDILEVFASALGLAIAVAHGRQVKK